MKTTCPDLPSHFFAQSYGWTYRDEDNEQLGLLPTSPHLVHQDPVEVVHLPVGESLHVQLPFSLPGWVTRPEGCPVPHCLHHRVVGLGEGQVGEADVGHGHPSSHGTGHNTNKGQWSQRTRFKYARDFNDYERVITIQTDLKTYFVIASKQN